jgi:hypothetical protein
MDARVPYGPHAPSHTCVKGAPPCQFKARWSGGGGGEVTFLFDYSAVGLMRLAPANPIGLLARHGSLRRRHRWAVASGRLSRGG